MIREFKEKDMDPVLDIWLAASIRAHDFVAADFWRSKLDEMRSVYLPASEIHVFSTGPSPEGFYALHGNCLAALFVSPPSQGKGIGSALVNHAKTLREKLELTVFTENREAVRFYRSRGFSLAGEHQDMHTGHTEIHMVWLP